MENKVKDYALVRELSGGRVVEIKPTSDGDEIIILHAITLFRNAESGWRCRASPLDYAHSISQTARDGKSCSGLLFYLGID